MKKLTRTGVAGFLLIALFGTGALATADTYPAANVLPEKLLHNKNYEIQSASSDGLINTYQLKTPYGPVTAESSPVLMMRAQELDALARMEKLKQSDVFKQALEKTAGSPLRGAEALFDAPVDTLKSAANGVGRWFSDVGRAIASDDPHQANVAKTVLGQSTAKRAFAYQFGVDPYSSFKPLQDRLDEIAWAATGGGLTIKAAFSFIPDVVGTIVMVTGTTEGMRTLVRDNSPAQLEKINRKKLESMKVPQGVIEQFLKNPAYTPQERTIFLGVVDEMKFIQGREKLIAAAARADDESKAVFLRYRAQMIANYVRQSKIKGQLLELDKTLFLKTKNGQMVGHFPVDSITATSDLDKRLSAFDKAIGKYSGVTSKILFVGGRVDPVVQEAMAKTGWKVVDREFQKVGE